MFDCFKKGYDYGGEEFIPEWGLIIPHTEKRKGALSYDGKYSEYVYGSIMAGMINIPHATRNYGGVFSAAKSLFKQGCNCSLEPHYNAYNGQAHGAEILVMKGDDLSAKYARLIMDDFSSKFPKRRLRHDNGIKWLRKGDRGYNNLKEAKSAGMEVALLSELFFGDNPKDFIKPSAQAQFLRQHIDMYGEYE